MTLYDFCYLTWPPLFKLFLRLEIYGRENIPDEGPVVIASNHLSLLDPPVLGASATRKVHFMAKSELFKPAWFGTLIRKLGAFPVKRGEMDREAIKTGLTILKENKVLAVFPEGTRSKTGEIGEFKGGAFKVAQKTGAPIIPVAIDGTAALFERNGHWIKPGKVNMAVLAPIETEGMGRAEFKELPARTQQLVTDAKNGFEQQ